MLAISNLTLLEACRPARRIASPERSTPSTLFNSASRSPSSTDARPQPSTSRSPFLRYRLTTSGNSPLLSPSNAHTPRRYLSSNATRRSFSEPNLVTRKCTPFAPSSVLNTLEIESEPEPDLRPPEGGGQPRHDPPVPELVIGDIYAAPDDREDRDPEARGKSRGHQTEGQRCVFLRAEPDLVVVVCQPAFDLRDAFGNALGKHRHDAGWPEAEPLPLSLHRTGG